MHRLFKILLAASLLSSLTTGCGKAGTLVFAMAESGNTERAQSKAPAPIYLDRSVLQTRALPPIVAQGPKPEDNWLAMNVPYEPIKEVRKQLQSVLPRPLTFFTGWKPEGEAHVTVISPIDFDKMQAGMKPGNPAFTMTQVGEVAAAEDIQQADLKMLGIGSGRAQLNGQEEETYFVVVESQALRRLRRKIHERYVASGGDPKAFDPQLFFPHITVGFTKRDLHFDQGVIKDMAHSRDRRFDLRQR